MRLRPGGFRLCLSVIVLALAGCARERPSSVPGLTDDWGRAVALAPAPRRIVSQAPATTELVFALGAGDRLVGRTTWCDWPEVAREVADVGNGIEPNVEAIVARQPDLVLLYPSQANRPALARLEAAGVRVAVLRQDAIAEWRATVRTVARLTDRAAAAESVLADFDVRLAASRVEPGAAALSVFIAVGANPPIAIGAGSFVSEVVTLAGGRNVFADTPAPSAVVSLEAIVARNPDVVLVLGPRSAAEVIRRRPGWSAIRAVRHGRVLPVDGSQFNRPSPRLPEAVAQLAQQLRAAASPCLPTVEQDAPCP